MTERVATPADAAEAFRTLAAAEGANIPIYAEICRIIAADPKLCGLLLEAPVSQRLPVIVLAAIHEIVLRDPELDLATWYPSISGNAAPRSTDSDKLGSALHALVDEHSEELIETIRTRSIQTNEVNRCCAWQLGLAQATAKDDRPLYLIEIGASGGLNLSLDSYRYEVATQRDSEAVTGDTSSFVVGAPESPVRLSTVVTSDRYSKIEDWQLGAPVIGRVGLDLNPLNAANPDDARWLKACVWPEQPLRFERLSAAIEFTRADPPKLVAGDVVDSVESLISESPSGSHVVVLSSWVLAYLKRERRQEFVEQLSAAATGLHAQGSRLTLLTLEADHILPWMQPPPNEPDAPAEKVHASILASTTFPPEGPIATVALARCQAHMLWLDPLRP